MATYLELPITLNETTKAIEPLSSTPQDLPNELSALNNLHRTLKSVPEITDGIPPPPVPVHPKRSSQIEKMRNAGNTSFRAGDFTAAIDRYTLAISMALTRPAWEPAQLMREELAQLFANRAQAHMGIGNWPEAVADAGASVEFKKAGNPKAYWRKGKALREMGRLEEAWEVLELGLEFGSDGDLAGLLKEVGEMLERRK